jgi:hypothetical protein
MKTFTSTSLTLALATTTAIAWLNTTSAEDRKPNYDSAGRFYLYSKDAPAGAMPFVPYGFMPAEAAQMVKIDPECKVKPNPEEGEKASDGTCIKLSIKWADPFWCGVAFLSGPDAPPWWGEDNRGDHYDFSGLKKKRLLFYARGETGKERIQVKFGILGDKKYGDSTQFPAESSWLRLTTDWQRFELPLDKYRASDLSRVSNAFTVVCKKVMQEGTGDTTFYLDTIFLE